MKITNILVSFLLLLFSLEKAGAQANSIFISYISSENSRDSHSTNETFSLIGKNLTYIVKYNGRKGPDQKDEEKKSVITDEQLNKLWAILREKKLTVVDSLIGNASANKVPYTSESIAITVTKENKTTKIKVRGSRTALTGKPLNTNSLYLIAVISGML